MNKFQNTIILMGPMATGKSTIALRLSQTLGRPNIPIDRIKWYYRFKNGYDLKTSKEILLNDGFEYLLKYIDKYFTISDLSKVLNEFSGIIDFGATDAFAETNSEKLYLLGNLLQPYEHVFLILPSKHEKKSSKILHDRLNSRYQHHPIKSKVLDSYISMNEKFLNADSYRSLAKHTVFIEDRNVDEVVAEIRQYVTHQKSHFEFDQYMSV